VLPQRVEAYKKTERKFWKIAVIVRVKVEAETKGHLTPADGKGEKQRRRGVRKNTNVLLHGESHCRRE